MTQTRICTKTGLVLTAGPVRSYRIARESYGPLAPKERDAAEDPATWGRFDTPGHTLYASAERTTAFMELLAQYRTDVHGQRRALQPLADSLAIPLDELWESIVEEWDQSNTMKASWLPRAFREGRTISQLELPPGWWIDITATETMAVLPDLLVAASPDEKLLPGIPEQLTTAVLTSEDREVTTLIASALRATVQLDDGTLPLGIEYVSKHGHPQGATGKCWAYWMRELDAGLSEPTTVIASSSIAEDDSDYNAALRLCKIKSR